MSSNTLKAFKNIINDPGASVNPAAVSSNRINNIGDALEGYVKDAYAGVLNSELSQEEKYSEYSKVFSWLGNLSNPPDAMLKGGDSIEVKKIESLTSDIALNSSFPKSKLHYNDSRVAGGAKRAEDWHEKDKDIVYIIGSVSDQKLSRLWFIYGDCYAASRETYERLINDVSCGIRTIPDIDFHDTNELAKIKKVDPLGITYMRVRGMWHIQNPSRLYSGLVGASERCQYYLLMREEKYKSFPKDDKDALEDLQLDGFSNDIICIRNPDNPAQKIQARFIKYEI